MLENIKALLPDKRPPKSVFLLVKESDMGIITYMNDLMKSFNKAYKEQVITFLKSVIEQLEDDKDA